MNRNNSTVSAWSEEVIIPTYPVGEPEKNPMFLEKRVYQGSSGVVYPHAVIEKIYDEKVEKKYKAVFLENEYIKIMVLPELGGRIQMAYDKVRQRHFVYYNQVIKPALVGLTGPWISGGIEFNWPQHHRPSTFEAIDHTIEEHADGSKTIWVNEIERMTRTKGMAGFRLYPGKAYIEIKGKLYNRTPFPQTFLWWANPAVKVNEHYQSVFPPDVHAVFDHGRRDVSSFPIATGTYYKVNYAPGTDISFYRNIPVPTSFMAVHSEYNFIGGYEHDTRAGLLHVADHHVSPGKKQWTWGNGDFGIAWDRNLTDEDGPYVELMTGVFTDNQPDFSWINPFEEKSFTQYFMPYQEVGIVGDATKDAVIAVTLSGKSVAIKLYVTAEQPSLKLDIRSGEKIVYSQAISSSPSTPFISEIRLDEELDPKNYSVEVYDGAGRQLLVYRPVSDRQKEIPSAAKRAERPGDIREIEQLFLTGLHLEQYRHATYVAADYYEEGLKRDPRDARCNNALGLWFLRRGKFEKAVPYFEKAVETLTERNPNPYDGEALFNLGTAYSFLGEYDKALDAFHKSVWNDAWQHSGYLNLARIACRNRNNEDALEYVEKSLSRNSNSHTARHLKVIQLRKTGRVEEALEFIESSLKHDRFNYGCLYEKYLLQTLSGNSSEAADTLHQLKMLSRNWVHNFIEYAWDYVHSGCYEEAIGLLELHAGSSESQYPMVHYYLAYFYGKIDEFSKALEKISYASTLAPGTCFPNRVEDVMVLNYAMEVKNDDSRAAYFLGNFWYDKRQYPEAIACWERSIHYNDQFPTVHRNMSLAAYNKLQDPSRALAELEKAFDLDTTDARVLMELDQLYRRLNHSPAERLAKLEAHLTLVESRDDLYLERITLYNLLGDHEKALSLFSGYRFHPWEGGEGKVVKQWLVSNTELAKQAITAGDPGRAIQYLEQASNYPESLGEGKLYNTPENDLHYLYGLTLEMMDQEKSAEEKSGNENSARESSTIEKSVKEKSAREKFEEAVKGAGEPVQAIFYNDPQPDFIFYQGLAWLRLGLPDRAAEVFSKLIKFGEEHVDDHITIDYFAVSLPDLLVFEADLDQRNRVHCLYMQGLGYAGLAEMVNGKWERGNKTRNSKPETRKEEDATQRDFSDKANQLFEEVLKLDRSHQGAQVHKNMINHLSDPQTNQVDSDNQPSKSETLHSNPETQNNAIQ